MRKLDMYWKSNRAWWEFRNHVQVIKDDAPVEAQISYERYIRQLNSYLSMKANLITGKDSIKENS